MPLETWKFLSFLQNLIWRGFSFLIVHIFLLKDRTSLSGDLVPST